MTEASTTKIRNYLLGNLTAEAEAGLEELYFAKPEYVAELWAVFADLAEQYQSGQLSESERLQFENRLQRSPKLREMFENEKALFSYAASAEKGRTESSPAVKSQPRRSRWFSWWNNRPLQIAAFSFGVLIAVGFWFVWQSRNASPTDSDQIAIDRRDDAASKPIPQPLFDPSPTPQPTASPTDKNQTTVATFFLSAQMFRSETDSPIIAFPKQTRDLRLELELATGDFPLYSAALQNESGETIRQWKTLSAQRSASADKIVLRFPAALLAEANYVVKITPLGGADNEAFAQQYRFTVKRP